MNIYLLLISCQVLLGQTLGHEILNKRILKDKYDEATIENVKKVNNAIHLANNTFSTTNIYKVLLDTLKALNMYEAWLPCVIDIGSVLYAAGKREMWALQMMDSGTKISSGILAGNIIDLGQYDECVNVQHGNITGQHCLIDFLLHFPNTIVNSMPLSSAKYVMAQCFPASCKPYMLRTGFGQVGKVLTGVFSSMNVSVTVDIMDKNCHTLNDRGDLDAGEILVLISLAALVISVSALTVLDYKIVSKRVKDRSPTKGELVIQAFSMYTNMKKLYNLQQDPEQMNCISGIKFLSIGWVVGGHRFIYAATSPLVNATWIFQMLQSWSIMIVLNAILAVDTFFLISGLLNAYIFCLIRDKISSRGPGIALILYSYIHRYIRLTPAYLIMIGLTSTWIYRLSDGPLWDQLIGVERNKCQKSFWANLLYLNNYMTTENICMMQSWYLAADMQMFWVSPFVIYPVWRWPFFGYIYLSILGFASLMSPILVSYFYDIKTPVPFVLDPVEEMREMKALYYPAHTKTFPYVMGIFVGYILYRIRIKKNIKVHMSKISVMIIWALAISSMFYAVFGGHYLYSPIEHLTLLESSLYIGFSKLFWAIGIAWVIFACTMGYGGLINSFLCLPILKPLGKLTYCIYLTHAFVMLVKFGSMRTANYLSNYDMLQQSLGEMIVIIVFSTALTLVSESPLMTLEKLIFRSGDMEGKTASDDQHASLRKMADEYSNDLNRFVGSFPESKNIVNPAIAVAPEEMNPALISILSRE